MPVWRITKIKALLSSIFDFPFFLTKFLQLKSTNRNTQNVIYKIKNYFSQRVHMR